jgi:hypothetical protein
MTLAELLAQPNGPARAESRSSHAGAWLTLSYFRHTILRLVYPVGAPLCVATVPYCGAELSRNAFSVEKTTHGDANLPLETTLEPLVVIEPPVFSKVEAFMTAAVPFTLSVLDTPQ